MPKIDMTGVENVGATTVSPKPDIVSVVESKGDGIGYGDVVATEYALEPPKPTEEDKAAGGAKWWYWVAGIGALLAVVLGVVYIKKRK